MTKPSLPAFDPVDLAESNAHRFLKLSDQDATLQVMADRIGPDGRYFFTYDDGKPY
jgi:predicted DNA-binding WGR domain protein